MLPQKHASSKWAKVVCLIFTYFVVLYSKAYCTYKSKIHDIDDLRKCLMQTLFNFEQDIIDGAIEQWRDLIRMCVCVCVLVAAILNTCSEINVHLYDS